MFNTTVTLFNYDEEKNKYYKTLLENTEFQPDFKTSFSSDSTSDIDSCLLIVRYYTEGEAKKISGNNKVFKEPKKWQNLSLEDKEKYFTLKAGRDFFVKGNLLGSKAFNYEEIKTSCDNVFFIHGVKDFADDLSHFEITGY